MPLLWLLLPLAAAALFFARPAAARATAYVDRTPSGNPFAADPLGDTYADASSEILGLDTTYSGGDALAGIAGIGEFILTLSRKIFLLPPAGEPYRDAIATAEAHYNLPQSLLARVLYQESHFRADIISGETQSPAGALGIAQFMPATARGFGIDPLNTDQAIDAAARYLKQLYDKFGDWGLALAAYNWGQGNVQRKGIAAAPKETRDYIAQILGDVQI